MARGELMSQDEADARVESKAAELAAAWAAFGIRIEDEAQADDLPAFYLLPDCVPVFNLWCDVQTQWRLGFRGPSGMDYAAVEAYLRMSNSPLRRDPMTIQHLRGMESAALAVFAAKREEATA